MLCHLELWRRTEKFFSLSFFFLLGGGAIKGAPRRLGALHKELAVVSASFHPSQTAMPPNDISLIVHPA